MPPKHDVIVGGRFHADHLALALSPLVNDLTLWTTLPKNRFPKPLEPKLSSFIAPEILFRVLRKMMPESFAEGIKAKLFSTHVARGLNNPQHIWSWSGFALEPFKKFPKTHKILMRDSVHYDLQMDILEEAYQKLKIPFRRNKTMQEREKVEYELSDTIFVPSNWARESFIERKIPSSKVHVLRLGVDPKVFFHPVVKNPTRKLQLLYFGSLSVQKGIYYLIEAVEKCKDVELTLIGDWEKSLKNIVKLPAHIHWYPSMSHSELKIHMKGKDAFILPTLQDGFSMALMQAATHGLALVTTPRCGAGELFHSPSEIQLVEPANSLALKETILSLQNDPEKLFSLKQKAQARALHHTWEQYTKDIQSWIQKYPQTA